MYFCERHAFICLFSRVLKVVYCARRAFSLCVCVCLTEKHLTKNDARNREKFDI